MINFSLMGAGRIGKMHAKIISAHPNAKLKYVYDVNKKFAKLCEHYKIKDAHFHDIRHQSLSNFMIQNKLSVGETMVISGHSDPRMLLRTYNNIKVEDISKKLN